MSIMEITIDHEGTKYFGQVVKIEKTTLGYDEDRSIFTSWLHLNGGGWGQGAGGYALDTLAEPRSIGVIPPPGGRRATAYGMDFIIQVLKTVGVSLWEEVKGKQVIALYAGDKVHYNNGVVLGIADLSGERVFIFKDHATEWNEEA